ncbi:TlpA family protein disulfide reductase [Ensifer canadensis]
MQRYGMRGTPTTIIIGRDGKVHHRRFGIEDDLLVEAWLATALAEPLSATAAQPDLTGCTADGCGVPDAVSNRTNHSAETEKR